MDWFCWENLNTGNHRCSHLSNGAFWLEFSLEIYIWLGIPYPSVGSWRSSAENCRYQPLINPSY